MFIISGKGSIHVDGTAGMDYNQLKNYLHNI